MPRFYRSQCKDCSKPFTFTEEILSGELLRGLSRPERCANCRKLNSRFVRSSGAAYWVAPIEYNDEKRCWGSFGLGQIARPDSAIEEIKYEEVDPNSPPPNFQKIAPVADRLIENLEDPNGLQFSVVVAPTGTGKSTWVPYRILQSKCSEAGRILVTSPRKAPLREDVSAEEATSVPGYIARALCGAPSVGAGQKVGILYKGETEQHDKYSRLLFITDGILIRYLDQESLDGVSVVFVDEAHEQSRNMEIIFALLKRKATLYPNLKIVIASATIDTDKFVDFFGDGDPKKVFLAAPDEVSSSTPHEITKHGFEKVVSNEAGKQQFNPPRKPGDLPAAAARTVKRICTEPSFTFSRNSKGDIVVFMPTIDLVDRAIERIDNLKLKNVDVFACHAQLDDKEYRKLQKSEDRAQLAQQKNLPTSPQRIIVATDYIKTSMTLPNLCYVVDSGYSMDPTWDSQTASHQYVPEISSLADCKQRAGRVGRTQTGEYFSLYDDEHKAKMPEFSLPEIARVPLDVALLSASVAGIDDLEEFDWLGGEAIQDGEIQRSITALRARGAIDTNGKLTAIGTELSSIQVDTVDAARAISDSDRFGCALEISSFMAFVSLQKAIFQRDKATSLLSFARLRKGCLDDFEFYLRLLDLFSDTGKAASFGLDPKTGATILKLRESYLSNYTRRTHTSIASREIDYSNLDKARFLIAQTSKEWIYQAKENELNSGQFESAFPELCPYEGPIRIDQDSSCTGSGDLDVMMCVKRSRVGDSDNVFGKHIIRLEREWLPLLGSASRFAMADLFQRIRVSPEQADETSQRIRNTDQIKADNEQLSTGIIEFDVVRVVVDEASYDASKKGSYVTAIVTETELQQDFIAHVSGLGRGLLKLGERYRAHISQQEKNELWVSFDQIRANFPEGTIVPKAKLLAHLIDDNEEVYGWLFQLEPGINARLLKNKGCDDELLKRLGTAETGNAFELTVLTSIGENIELSSPSVYDAAKTVFKVGDKVDGKLIRKMNHPDGSASGCVIQLLPGREGYLSIRDICKRRDLSITMLNSWRKGSRIPVVVKDPKTQEDLKLEFDWRPNESTDVINGYVSGFLESKNQHFEYAGVFVRISHESDGLLHWKAMHGLDFSNLKLGSKLQVRIASQSGSGQARKYSLELA